MKTIENHVFRRVGDAVQARINALPVGGKMQDLPEALWHESFRKYYYDETREGGPNMRMIRLDPQRPSLTVTGYIYNKFVHPHEDRFITVREAARLQGFPDEAVFSGTLTETQMQVGNAVPIALARGVLAHILEIGQAGLPKQVRALSLFSGAGGLDIGASHAGTRRTEIRPLLATDAWSCACATLRGHVSKQTHVVECDIRKISRPRHWWRQVTGETEVPDIVYGGPPCQSFSQAGKQLAEFDERGMLIFDFVRVVQKLRPNWFVMENVSNIRGAAGGRVLKRVLEAFDDAGYRVIHDVLAAEQYGAPQRRRRMFLIGTLDGAAQLSMPSPTHATEKNLLFSSTFRTVGDAFAQLPRAVPSNHLRSVASAGS